MSDERFPNREEQRKARAARAEKRGREDGEEGRNNAPEQHNVIQGIFTPGQDPQHTPMTGVADVYQIPLSPAVASTPVAPRRRALTFSSVKKPAIEQAQPVEHQFVIPTPASPAGTPTYRKATAALNDQPPATPLQNTKSNLASPNSAFNLYKGFTPRTAVLVKALANSHAVDQMIDIDGIDPEAAITPAKPAINLTDTLNRFDGVMENLRKYFSEPIENQAKMKKFVREQKAILESIKSDLEQIGGRTQNIIDTIEALDNHALKPGVKIDVELLKAVLGFGVQQQQQTSPVKMFGM